MENMEVLVSQLCLTLCDLMDYRGLHKLMSIKSVMPSNHLILCHPLSLLPSIFPSTMVFSSVSVLPIRWPKYWSFTFSISLSSEYLRLISFRIEGLNLLAAQGILKSLLQHHSLKAYMNIHSRSIHQCPKLETIQMSLNE